MQLFFLAKKGALTWKVYWVVGYNPPPLFIMFLCFLVRSPTCISIGVSINGKSEHKK